MSLYHVIEHTIDASHIREFARATSNSQAETLRLAVKQYVPKDNPHPRKGDLTIIAAHANGFVKVRFSFLSPWSSSSPSSSSFSSRPLHLPFPPPPFFLFFLHLPSWFDLSRDIIHMINLFRPPPPLLAVGHSFGACALTHASFLHPRLFAGLVLLEPVIGYFDSKPSHIVKGPAGRSIRRRDRWPSRRAAADSFQRSPFYQSWDPRVLDRWIEHGLCPVPGTEADVMLTTSKHQEVFTYLRPSWDAYDVDGNRIIHPEKVPDLDTTLHPNVRTFPFYRAESALTFAHLAELRSAVLYIIGGKSETSPPDLCDERTAATGTRGGASVKSVTNPHYGHLLPMEDPGYCAAEAAEFAAQIIRRWSADEDEFEQWTRLKPLEKTTVGDDFLKHLDLKPKI
ncbi:hypothetical protein DCS_06936 [Drechmeria coniospora]|uniref:AB hydrolase-1 domain-containing protein n=1 Tax=Drechmeria coniospora TaxID=98403 RepID=A0A151GD25_DRECN|nr:hypothetical protein DCS_06936 [Drechmeria coniospora]KYK54975.1 hypothetical protein DCS_06936 [Drechmeria coniospora]